MTCSYCARGHDPRDCKLPPAAGRGMRPSEAVRLLRMPEATLSESDCGRIAVTIESMASELAHLRQRDLFDGKRGTR